MIKRHLSLLTICMIINTCLNAQIFTGLDQNVSSDASNHATGSPQGTNIYNTNLYTGIANVSIPIYDYSLDDLNLGVSLGYSTQGVKVDQCASSVGMGWDVDGPSYIERVMSDLEDEVLVTNNGQDVWKGAWNAGNSSNNIGKNQDVFIANLAGRQLKFSIVLDGSTSWAGCSTCHIRYVTYPKSEVNIELRNGNADVEQAFTWAAANGDYTSYYFRITDERGTVFTFDVPDWQQKSVKIPGSNPEANYSYKIVTKWWASKIKTKSNAVISYSYSPMTVSYPIYRNEKVVEARYKYYSDPNGSGWVSAAYPAISTEIVNFTGVANNISQIQYPNGAKVIFEYRNIARKDISSMKILQNINVVKGYNNDQNIISYVMNQSYMYSGNSSGFVSLDDQSSTDELRYRLFLNTIDKVVNGNTYATENYYSFTYDEHSLPARLSPQQDYYGYYNHQTPTVPPNSTNNTSSITPAFAIPYHRFQSRDPNLSFDYSYGTIKTPDINYMVYGTLKKVKNSLGGEYEFYYQTSSLSDPTDNDVSYPNGESQSINTFDGLIVQKVEYRDGVSADNNRTIQYYYNNGYRFYKTLYFWYTTVYDGEWLQHYATTNEYWLQRTWLNSPVHQTNYFDGSNHGYSNVRVIEWGYNNEVISQSDYHYSNIMTTADDNLYDFGRGTGTGVCRLYQRRFTELNNTDASILCYDGMGILLDESHYIGNSTFKTSFTKYEYECVAPNYPNIISVANTLPAATGRPYNSGDFGLYWLEFDPLAIHSIVSSNNSYNNLPVHKYRLKKITKTSYFNSSSITDVKDYEYNDDDNITKIKWTDSKGDQYYKWFIYQTFNMDIDEGAHGTGDQYWTCQYEWKNGISKVTGGANDLVLFYHEGSSHTAKPILTNSFSDLKTASGVLDNAVNPVTEMEYTMRDNNNNVLETKLKNGIKYNSAVWDARIGEKIAEIDNAKYSDIAYTSFEGFGNNANSSSADQGRWVFNDADVHIIGTGPIRSTTITGKYIYKLTGQVDNTIQTYVNGDKDYILTYWADLPLQVSINSSSVTSTFVKRSAAANLNLYFVKISRPLTPTILNVSIKIGSTFPNLGYIDELRLYPVGATMSTSTYEPLFGQSNVCDGANNVLFYQYDVNGRLYRTIDVDGAILQQTTTSIQGPNN